MKNEEEIRKEIDNLTDRIGKETDVEYALIARKWALKWVLEEDK